MVPLTHLTTGAARGPFVAADDVAAQIMNHPGLLAWVRGENHQRPDPATGERKWWDMAQDEVGYPVTAGVTVSRFAAFNDHLAATFSAGDSVDLGNLLPVNGAPFTLMSVARFAAVGADQVIWGGTLAGGEWFALRKQADDKLYLVVRGNTYGFGGPAITAASPHLISAGMKIVGGNQRFWVELDGAAYGTPVDVVNQASLQNNDPSLHLGILASFGGFRFAGEVAEALAWSELSDADRATFSTYFKTRHGI